MLSADIHIIGSLQSIGSIFASIFESLSDVFNLRRQHREHCGYRKYNTKSTQIRYGGHVSEPYSTHRDDHKIHVIMIFQIHRFFEHQKQHRTYKYQRKSCVDKIVSVTDHLD